MKTCIKNLVPLPALIAALNLIPVGSLTAQTFTVLHSFAGFPSDGDNPLAGLILTNHTLYGTAYQGGSLAAGTVFAVNTDGTSFTNFHSFSAINTTYYTNRDGYYPAAGLILTNNILYGTAGDGGSSGNGTVFAVNTDGTGFTNLHGFVAGSGSYPHIINSEGAYPLAGLALSGNTLYGTANSGVSSGNGTVFRVETDGTGFTTLHSFKVTDPYTGTNTDGANPKGGLILSGNTLYGTAVNAGSADAGTVFAVQTDGTGFRILHSFTDSGDGANPEAGLILLDNTLYGTASSYYHGFGLCTVFAVRTDGTGFTILHSFTRGFDGGIPPSSLILLGKTLYGTTAGGGSSGFGIVFGLSLPPPQLTITASGTNVILAWPTNVVGFTLQSTTNLLSPAAWVSYSGSVVIAGQNTVTNPITGAQNFYRLIQ
jgi:uncharacterized repeat protein (TIGR03803 family)